jgi:hypothetical protein
MSRSKRSVTWRPSSSHRSDPRYIERLLIEPQLGRHGGALSQFGLTSTRLPRDPKIAAKRRPPKRARADIPAHRICAIFGLLPCNKSRLLIDHFVSKREQLIRDVQTECLCGLAVDCEHELRRLDNRKVGRFLALENAPGTSTGGELISFWDSVTTCRSSLRWAFYPQCWAKHRTRG